METANLTKKIIEALEDKKASNITAIDISEKTIIADTFIICDAPSTTLVKTLSDHVEETMEKEKIFVLRKEGNSQGRWIVLDYSSVIVHIFITEERAIYNIEQLWKDNN